MAVKIRPSPAVQRALEALAAVPLDQDPAAALAAVDQAIAARRAEALEPVLPRLVLSPIDAAALTDFASLTDATAVDMAPRVAEVHAIAVRSGYEALAACARSLRGRRLVTVAADHVSCGFPEGERAAVAARIVAGWEEAMLAVVTEKYPAAAEALSQEIPAALAERQAILDRRMTEEEKRAAAAKAAAVAEEQRIADLEAVENKAATDHFFSRRLAGAHFPLEAAPTGSLTGAELASAIEHHPTSKIGRAGVALYRSHNRLPYRSVREAERYAQVARDRDRAVEILRLPQYAGARFQLHEGYGGGQPALAREIADLAEIARPEDTVVRRAIQIAATLAK